MFLLGLVLPGTSCFLDLADYFLSHVRQFFSYFFKYFLRSFLSLFSFWDPYNANVGAYTAAEVSGCLRFFSFLFCILSCGSDFHHSVLQVTYLFFRLS